MYCSCLAAYIILVSTRSICSFIPSKLASSRIALHTEQHNNINFYINAHNLCKWGKLCNKILSYYEKLQFSSRDVLAALCIHRHVGRKSWLIVTKYSRRQQSTCSWIRDVYSLQPHSWLTGSWWLRQRPFGKWYIFPATYTRGTCVYVAWGCTKLIRRRCFGVIQFILWNLLADVAAVEVRSPSPPSLSFTASLFFLTISHTSVHNKGYTWRQDSRYDGESMRWSIISRYRL